MSSMSLGWTRSLVLGILAWAVGSPSASAQTLKLLITNSNAPAYSDSQIYITFETASGSTGFVASAPSGTSLALTQTGSLFHTTPLTLQQLGTGTAGGRIVVTTASSARAYVSYGSGVVFTSGAPSFASGTADPNFSRRWDVVELAVTPATGDQGDVTVINGIGIPMMLSSYTGSAGNYQVAQSTRATSNFAQLITSATAYQQANAANDNIGVAPYQTTEGGGFLRLLGINNGRAAVSGTTAGPANGTIFSDEPSAGFLPAQVGANALWGDYVNWVGTNSITTPIQSAAQLGTPSGTWATVGYTAVSSGSTGGPNGMSYATTYSGTASAVPWNSGTMITASWVNAVGGTSTGTLTGLTTGGTGYALQVTGEFKVGVGDTTGLTPNAVNNATLAANAVGSFTMIAPPDVISATGTNYILSNTLYGADPTANYGLIFSWTPTATGTTATYLSAADFVAAVQAAASGSVTMTSGTFAPNAGLGLVEQVWHDLAGGYNFGLVGSAVIDPMSGTSFNAAGSGYWSYWEALKNNPTAPQNAWSLVTGSATQWVASGSTPGWVIPSVTTATGTTLVGQIPLFEQLSGTAAPHYNQWAKIVYDSSPTAYGNPYSDYFQSVDVNLLATPNQSTFDVAYVELTILPDVVPIPEPGAAALLVAAATTLGAAAWRRRSGRRRSPAADRPLRPPGGDGPRRG